MYTIYKHTNTITGKSYIGYTAWTMEERWQQHVYNSRSYPYQYKFYNALRKYGTKCWKHEILDIIDEEQIAKEKEITLIAEFDTYHNGYNSTIGGEGVMFGRKHTPEAITKMKYAASLRGPEVFQKISESKKHMSVASHQNIRNGQLGRNLPHTTRLKMSESSRKSFLMENNDGRSFVITGLKNWCLDNSLNEKTLRVTLKTKNFIKSGSSKGWRVKHV